MFRKNRFIFKGFLGGLFLQIMRLGTLEAQADLPLSHAQKPWHVLFHYNLVFSDQRERLLETARLYAKTTATQINAPLKQSASHFKVTPQSQLQESLGAVWGIEVRYLKRYGGLHVAFQQGPWAAGTVLLYSDRFLNQATYSYRMRVSMIEGGGSLRLIVPGWDHGFLLSVKTGLCLIGMHYRQVSSDESLVESYDVHVNSSFDYPYSALHLEWFTVLWKQPAYHLVFSLGGRYQLNWWSRPFVFDLDAYPRTAFMPSIQAGLLQAALGFAF